MQLSRAGPAGCRAPAAPTRIDAAGLAGGVGAGGGKRCCAVDYPAYRSTSPPATPPNSCTPPTALHYRRRGNRGISPRHQLHQRRARLIRRPLLSDPRIGDRRGETQSSQLLADGVCWCPVRSSACAPIDRCRCASIGCSSPLMFSLVRAAMLSADCSGRPQC